MDSNEREKKFNKHVEILRETCKLIDDESDGEVGVFVIVNFGKNFIVTGNECPMCALNMLAQMNLQTGMKHTHQDERAYNIVPVLVPKAVAEELLAALESEDFEETEKLDKKKVN